MTRLLDTHTFFWLAVRRKNFLPSFGKQWRKEPARCS